MSSLFSSEQLKSSAGIVIIGLLKAFKLSAFVSLVVFGMIRPSFYNF